MSSTEHASKAAVKTLDPPAPATQPAPAPRERRDSDEGADEELDPRVEGALTDLNQATDDINLHEADLDAAKKKFNEHLTQTTGLLKTLLAKMGRKTIEKARPYFDAMSKARQSHIEARQAALRFEQLSDRVKQIKHEISGYEARLSHGAAFDTTLQQQLNAAMAQLAEAEGKRRAANATHERKTQAFLQADTTLMALARKNKKLVAKTQPYFTTKEKLNRILQNIQQEVRTKERDVADAKNRVATALRRLETISMEIHEDRRQRRLAQEIAASEARLAAAREQRQPVAQAAMPHDLDLGHEEMPDEDDATDDGESTEDGEVAALVHDMLDLSTDEFDMDEDSASGSFGASPYRASPDLGGSAAAGRSHSSLH